MKRNLLKRVWPSNDKELVDRFCRKYGSDGSCIVPDDKKLYGSAMKARLIIVKQDLEDVANAWDQTR